MILTNWKTRDVPNKFLVKRNLQFFGIFGLERIEMKIDYQQLFFQWLYFFCVMMTLRLFLFQENDLFRVCAGSALCTLLTILFIKIYEWRVGN